MKLRNKRTGEIVIASVTRVVSGVDFDCGQTLAELNEEWEDYEEPKSGIEDIRLNDMILGRHIVEIDFTKVEEAEKAVEKLKAWKRLKDKGFEFTDYDYTTYSGKGCGQVFFNGVIDNINEIKADLDLLFGGEE